MRLPTLEPSETNPWRESARDTDQYAVMDWNAARTLCTRSTRAPFSIAAMHMPIVAASRSCGRRIPVTAPTHRLRATAAQRAMF